MLADADHHPVAESVDQLPGAPGRRQAGRPDLHIGEALPTQFVDKRGWPVRRVPHRPPPIDRDTLGR
ncbi:hypothetical protein GCM10010429_58400 [Micromonospora olivasterospora]